MENDRQTHLRRRPLPNTPTSSSSSQGDLAAPRPVAAVLPDSFYGNPLLNLPQRTEPGSSFTKYSVIPSSETPEADEHDPPSYDAAAGMLDQSDWRSPVLVEDVKDDDVPPLVTDFQETRGRSPTSHGISGWDLGWFPKLEGRDYKEELNWWDPEVCAQMQRPGPGMLPTLAAEMLHDPNHSLFQITVYPPESQPPTSRVGSPSSSSSSLFLLDPVTKDEVLESVPNAHALYCRKENGWILLRCRQSTVLPPLSERFVAMNSDSGLVYHQQTQRQKSRSCTEEKSYQANLTHHYHRYPKAVSASFLNYCSRAWENASISLAHRQQADSDDRMEGIEPGSIDDESLLLDLYICCQCTTYILCSEVIPGILPGQMLDDFVQSRMEQPLPGQAKEDAAAVGLDTIIKIMENFLWKNETRAVPLTQGKAFDNKIGLTNIAMSIFKVLGFRKVNATASADASLAPPAITCKADRDRLLRAWVELGAWYQDFVKRHPPSSSFRPTKSHIGIENAQNSYLSIIGAGLDGIVHEPLRGYMTEFPWPLDVIKFLGFTPTKYSPDIVEFAYRAQCRCDPIRTPFYYDALMQFVQSQRGFFGIVPQELETLFLSESDRGRWAPSEIANAANILGFGRSNALKVEVEESEDEFVFQAWEDAMTRAWKEEGGGALRRKELTRALNVIAEARSSRLLKTKVQESYAEMTPDKAYGTLEVPSEVDEDMLIAVYTMRVHDLPSTAKRMKDALTVIAKFRDSSRLLTFLETGQDPGDAVQALHPEWPRGLNQLGNTCYLNSLLQYFYTIKELRTALILEAIPLDMKLSDDDLKRHRVGGRLVTRKEIMRSRKFVAGLASLFWELEYSAEPAITPELELAKLALVTSKDEEEDEHGRTEIGTDSSADTDATLVDESPIILGPSPAPAPASTSPTSPGSVLGKRQRDRARSAPSTDIDRSECDRDGYVMVPSPTESDSFSRGRAVGSEPVPNHTKDVDIQEVTHEKEQEDKPPPLPPRRKPEVSSESVMMFGKQHDVAECMDNCMFQIETALLRFDDLATTDKGKTSVVKRLFFGKIRQRITPVEPDLTGRGFSVHEKEDMFSHLPVNVSEESFDIYDGLSNYFDDLVEFQGRKMKMEVSLVDVPPILQIQLQRVQFNRDTLQPYKSHAYVRFGETLYIDRFLDSVAPAKRNQAKAIQSELNTCRDRIHALTRDKSHPLTDSLSRAHDFLLNQDVTELDVDDDLLAHLEAEHGSVKAELVDLRGRAARLKEDLEIIWADEKTVEYELTSVFVHRGSSPSWGHYFFYSRCLPDKPDMWFKYNDSEVSLVKKDEVLADTTGSTANPYLLVYARKDMDMVQTVHRATDVDMT